MSRLISEWPGHHFWDIQWSWMWIKVKLPAGVPTEGVIRVTAAAIQVPDGPYVKDVNSNYPVDTSFVRMNVLDNAQRFEIHGVTFLFGIDSNSDMVEQLRRNYIYRVWLQYKWFHQGPLLLFPGHVDMDVFWKESREFREEPGMPWVDMWVPPLHVMPGINLGIELQGNPIIPTKDMEFVIGLVGKMERPVQ